MVVSSSPDGRRVMVLASKEGLDAPLIRVDGSWSRGTFSADDLKDNFVRVSGNEATALFKEAKAAFSSNPKRFKASSRAD
jgi:hypothetical protein